MSFKDRGCKSFFLLFDTKHKCKLISGGVESGEGNVGNKKFVVDDAQPMLLNKPFLGSDRYYPLYFVKWDDIIPKTLSNIKNLKGVDIKKKELTPEMIKALSETNLLLGLFKKQPFGKGGGGGTSVLVIGGCLFAGMILMYFAMAMGFVPL